MKPIKNIIILLVGCVILIGCSGPYTYKDSGKKIEISDDDAFQIVLQGEINSSYSWQLASENEFVILQKPVDTKTVRENILYTFNFKAKDDGEDKIVLVYTDGIESKKTFELNVIIGTMGVIYND